MTHVSCFYGFLCQPEHIKLVFIKFNNYIIIHMYPYKPIILSYKTLIFYPRIFQFYILSLLITENTQKLDKYINIYTHEFFIKTTVLSSIDDFMDNYSNICISNSNLLNKNEPLRQSSNKKINKFIKILIEFILH